MAGNKQKFEGAAQAAEWKKKMFDETPKMRQHWNELVTLEPRLQDLFNSARALKNDGSRDYPIDHAKVWYLEFKPRVVELVGFRRKDDPVLGTSRAYDVAYELISNEVDRQISNAMRASAASPATYEARMSFDCWFECSTFRPENNLSRADARVIWCTAWKIARRTA